jgi:beta-galactosidase/beta-glucuronidase
MKIEPPLFYRACDELGLLVLQDMPAMMRGPNADQQAEFVRQLELLVNQFKSYPSIFTWVGYSSLCTVKPRSCSR